MGFGHAAESESYSPKPQTTEKPEGQPSLDDSSHHDPLFPRGLVVRRHRRGNAAEEARSPETPRPVAAVLRCKSTTLRLRLASHTPRSPPSPGARPRRPWLLRPPLPVPSPLPDATDYRPLRLRARSRQARRLRTRDPRCKHLAVVLLDRIVCRCS